MSATVRSRSVTNKFSRDTNPIRRDTHSSQNNLQKWYSDEVFTATGQSSQTGFWVTNCCVKGMIKKLHTAEPTLLLGTARASAAPASIVYLAGSWARG